MLELPFLGFLPLYPIPSIISHGRQNRGVIKSAGLSVDVVNVCISVFRSSVHMYGKRKRSRFYFHFMSVLTKSLGKISDFK
jgi:hypothetical protein